MSRATKHRTARLTALRLACSLGLLAGLLWTVPALAQDQMVPKEELIRQLGGQEPTAPPAGLGKVRLRGPAGVKSTGDQLEQPSRPKEVAILIHFRYDSTELADEFSRRQLREAGEAFSSNELRGLAFEIGGHTDAQGSDAYNLELSRRRAQTVKDVLCRGYKVDCGAHQVKGYGKSEPVAGNDDEAGRSLNRRVVFKRLR